MTQLSRERLEELANRQNVGVILGDEIAEMARRLLAAEAQVDEVARQAGIDPAVAEAYMQGYHDSESRKPAQPAAVPDVVLHMGQAIAVFEALKGELVSEHVLKPELGAMGAINVQIWTSKTGDHLQYETMNGGCSLFIKPAVTSCVAMPDEIRLLQSEVTIWKDRWAALRDLFHEVADALGCDVKDNDAMIEKIRAMQPVVLPDELYKIASHIASAKGGLPDEWQDWAEEIETDIRRAALLNTEPVSQPYTLPDGWKLVPVEPTAEMYDAGDQQLATKQVWDAMLAAAPQEPTK